METSGFLPHGKIPHKTRKSFPICFIEGKIFYGSIIQQICCFWMEKAAREHISTLNNRKEKRRPILPGKMCRNDDIDSVECKQSTGRLVQFDRLNTVEVKRG